MSAPASRPSSPPRGTVAAMPAAAAERDEDRAWLDLALALRVVTPDAPGPAGIDYERAANRVQTSPASPDEVMLSLARAMRRGSGVDRVAEKLAALRPAEGTRALRAWHVLGWVRRSPCVLEWITVGVSRDATAEAVADARCEVLDKLTEDAGLSTPEERAAWAASAKPSGARRQWARLRLREAWCLWYGETW